jgi:hypothetical protein
MERTSVSTPMMNVKMEGDPRIGMRLRTIAMSKIVVNDPATSLQHCMSEHGSVQAPCMESPSMMGHIMLTKVVIPATCPSSHTRRAIDRVRAEVLPEPTFKVSDRCFDASEKLKKSKAAA